MCFLATPVLFTQDTRSSSLFLIFRHSLYNMHECHNCPYTCLFVIFMVSFYEHKLLFLRKYFLPLLQLKVHSKIEQKLQIPSGGIFRAP